MSQNMQDALNNNFKLLDDNMRIVKDSLEKLCNVCVDLAYMNNVLNQRVTALENALKEAQNNA